MRNLFTKLKGMRFSVFQHAFSTGVFIVYANSTRKSRVWRKWRRGTRTSSLSSAVHPHFSNRGRDINMNMNIYKYDINMNIMYLPVPSFVHVGHVFLLALGYCILSYQLRLREYSSMNTTGWKVSLSIFDIVFALIHQKFSLLVNTILLSTQANDFHCDCF